MILDLPGRPKLTYCLNVHPGEGWEDQLGALTREVPWLKERLSCAGNFGVGLRLSARGVRDLEDPGKREAARIFFQENGLDPFTFNGFPYGTFHGTRVKEKVYEPDWKTRERVDYTKALAAIMAGWLGKERGSISTVPGTFGEPVVSREDQILMAKHLAECACYFHGLYQETGCEMILGLEPEPACFLETTGQLIQFFESALLIHGRKFLESEHGFSSGQAEVLLRRHLGICLDTCHSAIQFERIEDSIQELQSAGIGLAKIQISNALELRNSAEARQALADFVEPVYLHQVRAQERDGCLRSWTDLPEGLSGLEQMEEGILARVHFHVPLFWEGSGVLGSTQKTLTPEFWKSCADGVTPHLEMETYTFSVLPERAGALDLAEMLEREYHWVLEKINQ